MANLNSRLLGAPIVGAPKVATPIASKVAPPKVGAPIKVGPPVVANTNNLEGRQASGIKNKNHTQSNVETMKASALLKFIAAPIVGAPKVATPIASKVAPPMSSSPKVVTSEEAPEDRFNDVNTPIEERIGFFQNELAAPSEYRSIDFSTCNLKGLEKEADEAVRNFTEQFVSAYKENYGSDETKELQQSLQDLYKNPTLSGQSKAVIEKCMTAFREADPVVRFNDVNTPIKERRELFKEALDGKNDIDFSTCNLRGLEKEADQAVWDLTVKFYSAKRKDPDSDKTEKRKKSLQDFCKNPTLSGQSKAIIEKCMTGHESQLTFSLPPTGGVKASTYDEPEGIQRGGQRGPDNKRSLEKKKEIKQATRSMKFEDFEDLSSLVSKQFPDFSRHLKTLKGNNDPEYGTIINNFISQYKLGKIVGKPLDVIQPVKYEAMIRANQPETFKGLNQLNESQNPEDVKKYQEYTEKLRDAIMKKFTDNQNEGLDNLLNEIKNIGKN